MYDYIVKVPVSCPHLGIYLKSSDFLYDSRYSVCALVCPMMEEQISSRIAVENPK